MIRIINESFNPYFNLALEEYLLKEFSLDGDLFVFWQNSPAVIVGRNQDTASEIDREFVSKNGVAVVRRLTGGGAVYHDLGNLNFTWRVGLCPGNIFIKLGLLGHYDINILELL